MLVNNLSRLLSLARDLICCERVDDLDRFPHAWRHDGYGFCVNLNAWQMVRMRIDYSSGSVRGFLRHGMVIGCRLQLWQRSVWAISIRSFEPLSIIDWRVDGKIGRSWKPVSKTILVSKAVAKLGSVRILCLQRRGYPTQCNNASQRQNQSRKHVFTSITVSPPTIPRYSDSWEFQGIFVQFPTFACKKGMVVSIHQ